MYAPFVSYFTDPVLRAPMIGSMLMCFSASLVGVILFLRKQSLTGEALSHAAYPGVMLGAMTSGFFDFSPLNSTFTSLFFLGGALCTSLLSLGIMNILVRKLSVPRDASLCFVLSAFFGTGITLASYVQFSQTSLYRQTLAYLMGQAATMTDTHIAIYGILSLIVTLLIILFYKELQILTFDREYAKSLGISVKEVDSLFYLILALAIVIGIRSVGVVLMSAMLIAPAASARQYTNKLPRMFILSGIFGIMSGFLGNFLSVELSYSLTQNYPQQKISLPSGPMIVVIASIICVFSLLFSPARGYIFKISERFTNPKL